MNHAARDHAEYGGSNAHRWLSCHASIKEARRAPPRPASEWALDGTKAHELLEDVMLQWMLVGEHVGERMSAAAYARMHLGHDGKPYSDEQCHSVQVVLDYVSDILHEHHDAVVYVEREFKFPSMVTDEAWGMNDILIYVPSSELLYVIDFKHGAGVPVEIETNDPVNGVTPNNQLMFYAAGAVATLNLKVQMIALVIIQPRYPHKDGPVRTHWTWPHKIEAFKTLVDEAVVACESDNPLYVPSRKNCHWCPGIFCVKRDEAAGSVMGNFKSVKVISISDLPKPHTMDIERLVQIVANEKMITDFIDEAKAYLKERAMVGDDVPGMKLVESNPRREFDQLDDTVADTIVALTGCDIDEIYPRKLAGITVAERLLKEAYKRDNPDMKAKDAAALANRVMATLTTKDTTGKYSLVPLSDGRPAVKPAQQTFASVNVPALPKP